MTVDMKMNLVVAALAAGVVILIVWLNIVSRRERKKDQE
jgi:hypothetical protein